MPQHLGRFSDTNDAVKVLIAKPEDRSELGRRIVESVGGGLLGYRYCFGEFDGVFIAEAGEAMRKAAAATYTTPTA
jgi:uncharacterized protein with GYD domain